MTLEQWFSEGYKAGCQFLAKQSDYDLLDCIDKFGLEDDSVSCEVFDAFCDGFSSAYGVNDDE